MSIAVEVGLLSGRTATLKADLHEEVESLKFRARAALRVGTGRLVDSSGSVLDANSTIQSSGIQNGDSPTLHIYRVEIQASCGAFAAILGDGSVVTWGAAGCGGDSSALVAEFITFKRFGIMKPS